MSAETAPVRPFEPGLAEDLPAVLRARAASQPEGVAFHWLGDGERVTTSWTYAELDARARAIAARLAREARPGDRAMLLYPPGLDFIAAFWGCLYAGIVPAPVFPPRDAAGLPLLLAVAADCRATLALTTHEALARTRLARWFKPALRAMRWLATDDVGLAAPGVGLPVAASEIALLQYTSGSTGTPRGVVVAHANVLANAAMLQEAWAASGFAAPGPTRFMSWLPLYHDMGLIGMTLTGLAMGATTTLMSPLHFLQRPARWLTAITHSRAEVSAGPNFAYDLCVRKAREEPGLDLSSWVVAMNGAEPVRAESLAQFSEAFASVGFRPTAHYPCYGLAEATLFVTGGLAQAPVHLDAHGRVACGRAWGGTEVRLADPETGAWVADGTEGEVWVRGPGVARGYWNQPEAQGFGQLAADGSGPWLRTGDLGIFDGGELVVTGRLKDLIILRGRNLYPQDVERTVAAAHPGLRPGRGAAFSHVVAGEERLIVVHEVDRTAVATLDALDRAVRRAVVEAHEAAPYEMVWLAHGGLPTTSSGKVRRRTAREAYLAGQLPRWKGPRA